MRSYAGVKDGLAYTVVQQGETVEGDARVTNDVLELVALVPTER